MATVEIYTNHKSLFNGIIYTPHTVHVTDHNCRKFDGMPVPQLDFDIHWVWYEVQHEYGPLIGQASKHTDQLINFSSGEDEEASLPNPWAVVSAQNSRSFPLGPDRLVFYAVFNSTAASFRHFLVQEV